MTTPSTTRPPVLLLVGDAIVAYQRDLGPDPTGPATDVPWQGPWASGSPAIMAYVAARLGVPTALVAGIGDDAHGRIMREALERGGVSTSHLVTSPAPTATARITYRGTDDRSFEFDVVGTAATDVPADAVGRLPEQVRWVHLSGSALLFGDPLASTALATARRAVAAGASLSVDPNVRPDAMEAHLRVPFVELVQQAHVLLPSEGELAALGLSEDDLVDAGAVVCTTLGAAGAVVRTGRETVAVPAAPGAVVDTDGAGDSFAAGFVAATLLGAHPVSAARCGAQVAARAVAVHGPTTVVLDGVMEAWA